MWQCGISDTNNEEVIITGGLYTQKTVSVYSEAGWNRDLPTLNQGKYHHACGSYVNGGKKVNHFIMFVPYIFDRYIQLSVSYGHWGMEWVQWS